MKIRVVYSYFSMSGSHCTKLIDIDALTQDWISEADDPAERSSFSDYLVRKGVLTQEAFKETNPPKIHRVSPPLSSLSEATHD